MKRDRDSLVTRSLVVVAVVVWMVVLVMYSALPSCVGR